VKTLPSEQMAVREADAARKTRDDTRESFERHITSAKTETGSDVGRAEHVDIGVAAAPGANAKPFAPSAVVNAVPLTPTDALFGSGARVYPQGLAVVGYLSMLAAATDTSPAGPVVLAADTPAVNATMPPAFDVPSIIAAEHGDADVAAQMTKPVGRVSTTSAEGAEGVDDASDATPVSTGMADIPAWLARRVSFAGRGEATTLRLRDYRIGESGHGELVDQLLGFADTQGQSVGRVVINGREVWRRDGMDTHINEQGVTWHGS